MKKKIFFLVFALLVFCFSVNAQFNIGLTAGVPFKLNNLNVNEVEVENSRPFNIGLITEAIFFPLGVGFEISALYELEKISGENIVEAVNVGYVIIPVNFKWKVGFRPLKFFVKAGPSFALLLHDSGNIGITKNGVSFKNFKPKPFNFGVNAGVGFEIMSKFQLGISYFYNFCNPFVEESTSGRNSEYDMNNNGGFVASLSYFF
ncbi:MAG: outer membrane beta-barrel protein [Bacteroidales bacterium]